ncbi:hypothetical protein FE634_01675 [Nocardioides dongxiaopingii]|uniref:hypothetical protein n=1 Tax=Nocardioides TaxID=1839 RepID=UPI0010C768BD|nr:MULTISPECIES: hypothetical protein [Nocardioides]QCW49445.1 hypothetical protein FE634_01675 [Nocardioides sp. S-1144]
MYGDTDVMRRRADQLREQATDIRTMADQLVAHTEVVGWSGRAADSMRVRVTERASHLRAAAADHDAAAEALDKHVLEVDTAKDAIAEVERRAGDLVAEARTRLARVEQANADADGAPGGARIEPDHDDVVLAAFDPPPAGHRDWLAVELPGL